MAWLSHNWDYRQKINVTGQSGAGTDYQVKLLVGESSGASGEDFHLDNKSDNFPSAKDDGGDLRFTDNDGTTLLDFWVVQVTGTTPNRLATIFVKVNDNLDSNQAIYCYYGNDTSGLSSDSDGDATFLLFDDFDDSSLDVGSGGLWSWVREPVGDWDEGITEADKLNIKTTDTDLWGGTNTAPILQSQSIISGDFEVLIKLKFSPTTDFHTAGVMIYNDDSNWVRTIRQYNSGQKVQFEKEVANSPSNLGNAVVTDTELFLALSRISNDVTQYHGANLNSLSSIGSTTISLTNRYASLLSLDVNVGASQINALFDYILVRKRVATEPSFSSSDGEETWLPSATTQGATQIGSTIATLNGDFTLGEESEVEVWFEYWKDESGASHSTTSKQAKTSSDSFSADLTSLDLDTTYKFKALVQGTSSGATIEEGSELSFTTCLGTINNITRIRYYNNKLYICGNGSNTKVGEINLSTGQPIWQITSLDASGETYTSPQDLAINETFDYMYVANADGKIAKIDLSDFSNRSEIDLEDTDDLVAIETLDDSLITYAGTTQNDAEVYMIDEHTTTKINTDFRFGYTVKKIINTIVGATFGKKINTDLRFGYVKKTQINTDLRFSPYAYDTIDAIGREDFKVYIDDVQTDDVDLSSIVVRHLADNQSEAEFTLARHHDKLDYIINADGSFTFSEITAQNNIKVYIQSNLIFEGTISDIRANADTERVAVRAESEGEWTQLITTVNLPLPSVNEQQHLYHALVRSVSIQDPEISELSDPNDIDTIGGTIKVTGLSASFTVNKKRLFGTGNKFSSDVEGLDIDIVSGTNFTKGRYRIIKWINSNTIDLDRSPVYNADGSGGIGYISNNPKYFRGITVDLGVTESERVTIQGLFGTRIALAQDILEEDWTPDQNWTYFWFVDGKDLITFASPRIFSNKYIGTSLQPITYTIYDITGVFYYRQREWDNLVFPNGYYYVGTFPYQEVSVRKGALYPDVRLEDREDGLYKLYPEGYDYTTYAQEVADLEYERLQNINGNIFPLTSADIDLTIDGWFYYNIKLLTRLNITNTIESNIYKDNNGFPVSVKAIEINSNDMLVHLRTSNNKSQSKLKRLNDRYPDEPDTFWGLEFKIADKYDLPTFTEIV